MGPRGEWTVLNTTSDQRRVSLSVNLVSVGLPRGLALTLEGVAAGRLVVGIEPQDVRLGPWRLAPGRHTLVFVAEGEPIRPSTDVDRSSDRRALTVAFRGERWIDDP